MQDEYLDDVLKTFPDKLLIRKNKYDITSEKDTLKIFKDAYEKRQEKVLKK